MKKREQIVLVLMENGQYKDEHTGLTYQEFETGLKVNITTEDKLCEAMKMAEAWKLKLKVAEEIEDYVPMLEVHAKSLAQKFKARMEKGVPFGTKKYMDMVFRVTDAIREIEQHRLLGSREADALEHKLRNWIPANEGILDAEMVEKFRECKEIEINYMRAKGATPKEVTKLVNVSRTLSKKAHGVNAQFGHDKEIQKAIDGVTNYIDKIVPSLNEYYQTKND